MPGRHPVENHLWNMGIEYQKNYLNIVGMNPNLLDEDRPDEEIEPYWDGQNGESNETKKCSVKLNFKIHSL